MTMRASLLLVAFYSTPLRPLYFLRDTNGFEPKEVLSRKEALNLHAHRPDMGGAIMLARMLAVRFNAGDQVYLLHRVARAI